MSIPLPLFPSRRKEKSNQNLFCHDVFLDCDERFDIYQVKAVERPHLLHFITADVEDAREETLEEGCKENGTEPLPLMDGCDLPGWRKEGLMPFTSNFIQGVLNVGASCTFFRRDRQWPILPFNSDECTSDDDFIIDHTSSILLWKELKHKLKTIQPKPNREARVLDNATYSQMIEIPDLKDSEEIDKSPSNKCQNAEEHKRMATKFAVEIEQANVPAKILGGTKNWKCMPVYGSNNNIHKKEEEKVSNYFTGGGRGGWTFANLLERYGDIRWRFSDTHGEMMALSTYAKYITSHEGFWDDSPLGIYDAEFGDYDSPTHEMIEEYEPPTCFSPDLFQYNVGMSRKSKDNGENVSSNRPPWRWILIGPERSGTGLHVDPLWTNAWVTVLQGLKRWVLFPSHVDKEQIGMVDNQPQIPSVVWFRDYYDLVTSDEWPKEWRPVEVLQKPGETVFVPNGWPHLVLNLELTVAVTHNYASEFGPFERMWRQVEQDEQGFAKSWYKGMLTERPDLAERMRCHVC